MRTVRFRISPTIPRHSLLPGFLKRSRVVKTLRYTALSVFGLPFIPIYRQPLGRALKRALGMLQAGDIKKPAMLLLGTLNYTVFYALWVRHPWGEAKIRSKVETSNLHTLDIAFIVGSTGSASPEDIEVTLESIRTQDFQGLVSHVAVMDPALPPLTFRPDEVVPEGSEFVCFLQAGDRLTPDAISRVAACIDGYPKFKLIYSDHDYLIKGKHRCFAEFKPDWNYELSLARFYLQTPVFFSAASLERLGFSALSEPCSLPEVVFTIYENHGSESIAHIPAILCHRPYSRREDCGGELEIYGKAVAAHLARRGEPARIERSREATRGLSVHFPPAPERPLVSIIIPTRNRADLLRNCIESIEARTAYDHYEILVIDNGSDEAQTLDYFREIAARGVRVIPDPSPFNFSAINNRAAEHAQGQYLAFLNNDIEVITPDWLGEMLGLAARPGIGAVGARLWYPNDRLQHAGVILVGGVAGHAHKFLPRGLPGYCDRAVLLQEFSAVTAACMVIRKASFVDVGGFDPDLAVAFNDVDLCLRLKAAGYRNVWTPAAELYHHESLSRGNDTAPDKIERFRRECAYMRERWGDFLRNDPAYSPNLAWDNYDFSLSWERPKF
ncbi:glycosyltransferase family 2 protein [Methylococcus mesophilus]|uniref:glycosyltransferase family 2 protein n=1 Tax=Methylococcus mesophilus TaxID=2993564 RepID=UPI00224B50CF|nr:glycosyltransferase family 2 protein [Methylococcus mesophilus]UZR28312.1 glycosyltransferase family 2 protein [Methylococcus mesophilus]